MKVREKIRAIALTVLDVDDPSAALASKLRREMSDEAPMEIGVYTRLITEALASVDYYTIADTLLAEGFEGGGYGRGLETV